MAEMKIIKKKLDEIREYEQNPRKNDKAVGAVLESIKKFGFRNPIIINREGVILAGHTRLAALRKSGAEEAECIEIGHLTLDQEKAFRIADNRVADFSAWNGDLLEAEMADITADDWELFGFKEKEIKARDKHRICTCPKCGASFEK